MGTTTAAFGVEETGSRGSAAAAALASEPTIAPRVDKPDTGSRCRTNSRRGLTDPKHRSYPPVEALCRGLDVLRTVNKFSIASVADIHQETGIPKPSVVRLLETLMVEGYVARDNMCGGYRVTHRVHELYFGYAGISQVIEIARPLVVDLTQHLIWPIGIGVIEGHTVAIKFWTGAVSPCAARNTALGARPDLLTSAMGRAYLGFCPDEERERHLRWLRIQSPYKFDDAVEFQFRRRLQRVRDDGYAMRDADKKNNRFGTTTLAVPIMEGETVHALVSISFFTTAIPASKIAERIVAPLRETATKIEDALAFVNSVGTDSARTPTNLKPDF